MVSLTPLTPDDFQRVAGWLSDPTINRWLTSEWRGREVSAVVVAVACRNRRSRLFLVQVDAHPCGLVGFADIDEGDRTAMIWYVMGEKGYEGKGVISQAVGQAAEWGFTELGLVSVYAYIMADNVPSRKVLEKNEFLEVGRLRFATRSADRQVDRIYFDLLNPAGVAGPVA